MQDDLVLKPEDVIELAVVALGPDLARTAVLEREGEAKTLACRLSVPLSW